jgi:hypothetical protein
MYKQIISRTIVSDATGNRVPSPLSELCACAPEDALARLQASRVVLRTTRSKHGERMVRMKSATNRRPVPATFHASTPFNGVLFAVASFFGRHLCRS